LIYESFQSSAMMRYEGANVPLIDDQRKNLIIDLTLNKIDIDQFYSDYPDDIRNDGSYVGKILSRAREEKDSVALELMLCLRSFQKEVEPTLSHQELLKAILLESWHHLHEMILDGLDWDSDSSTVEAIYQTAVSRWGYLDDDDNVYLTIKCIYALSSIHSAEAVRKIYIFLDNEDRRIRDVAAREVERLGGSSLNERISSKDNT